MRRLIPKSRMGIFALLLVVLWIFKLLFLTPRLRYRASILGFLLDLVTFLLAIPASFYIWKLFKTLRSKLLWKIRRRLIIAHVFVGVIPVFLVIGIFYVSALLLYYQLSYFLISNQIGMHTSQIHAYNLSLRERLQDLMSGTTLPSPSALKTALDTDAKYLLDSYPSAAIILRFRDPVTDQDMTFVNRNINPDRLTEYRIPRWLGDREFSGLVVEDLQPQIYRPALPGRRKEGLFLRSVVFSDFRPDFPFSLEVSVPFDRYLLGRLKAALGQDMLLADHVAVSGLNVMLQNMDILRNNIVNSTFEAGSAQLSVSPVWSILLFPTSWVNGVETSSADSDVLFVELSTSKLLRNVFRSESAVGKTILSILQITVGFFLVVEIVSIVIGIMLTKSITNAVHSLDRGTEFVKRGDFSHRIVVRSDDQLGALAASFNQMTEYVQHLVSERVEKERLQRELEIAKEVQEQLFPNHAPHLAGMELSGVCLPARTVSGDYYDFLQLGAHELGLALGDICGKGISAALLMANLQATLRSNVLNLSQHECSIHTQNGGKAVSEVMQRLNNHIYSSTAANKFASFFYAVYNETQQTLTYCNAGHNPPLFFKGEEVRRLNVGGTVVGVFADTQYDQETIHLNAGDLFIAYTDGIVESTNEYGEEFGENRLIQLVQQNRYLAADEIQRNVVDQVLSWTFEEERSDDMTLIVARIVGR